MKERCKICEKKMKKGAVLCKACKASADETLLAGFHAVHHAGFISKRPVNLILTDSRLLMFVDISAVNSQNATIGLFSGGLIGYAIGKSIDNRAAAKSTRNNGKLKLIMPFASINNAEFTNTSGGFGLNITLAGSKTYKFMLGVSLLDPATRVSDFKDMLETAMSAEA